MSETDPLFEIPVSEPLAPILAPGRLTAAICQLIVRDIVEHEPRELTPTPSVGVTPTLMLTRYLGGFLFGWNPLRHTYEVRDADTNQLLFASAKAGRDLVMCELTPMQLEKVWEELNGK